MVATPAGVPHQDCGFQYLLSSLPPIVLALVAPTLCPSLRQVHEVLLWFFSTLYPWDQQYPFGSHLENLPQLVLL